MRFTWEAFDLTFLKSIIEASDIKDKDIYLETDDKDIVIGCITNNICSLPDSKFISEYRNIIDNVLLPKYDTQVDEICKALYITERSRNGKLMKLHYTLSVDLPYNLKTTLPSNTQSHWI